ncbi:MAG TPA: histidine phosphatase family protein [Candidatus Saccharimonadales bacterium]|jgi:broad specificity phosphatase PhoE|nr:histidine phosphatase family protein [Candidatus Saccharimonadales bacterium]
MVTITYFVHGTTTDNEEDLATGWLPGELSEKGIEQAKQLGVQAAGKQFEVVFCSDLKRAVDSAQLGFGETYTVIQDDRLREINYGDLNGMPTTFKDNLIDYIDSPFPNGESYRDVENRMESFCTFLKALYDGRQVAIVAHQAPQLALEVILNGKAWPQAFGEDWRRTGKWQPGWTYVIS